jgi:hypothetical protein
MRSTMGSVTGHHGREPSFPLSLRLLLLEQSLAFCGIGARIEIVDAVEQCNGGVENHTQSFASLDCSPRFGGSIRCSDRENWRLNVAAEQLRAEDAVTQGYRVGTGGACCL